MKEESQRASENTPTLSKIFVKKNDKIIPISPNDIHVIASEGNYLELNLDEKSYMVRDSLKSIKEKLNRDKFIQIHRSYIVNIDKIAFMEAANGGDYNVKMENGDEVRMSRRYKEVIDRLVIR